MIISGISSSAAHSAGIVGARRWERTSRRELRPGVVAHAPRPEFFCPRLSGVKHAAHSHSDGLAATPSMTGAGTAPALPRPATQGRLRESPSARSTRSSQSPRQGCRHLLSGGCRHRAQRTPASVRSKRPLCRGWVEDKERPRQGLHPAEAIGATRSANTQSRRVVERADGTGRQGVGAATALAEVVRIDRPVSAPSRASGI
jgi:hypothetical protein